MNEDTSLHFNTSISYKKTHTLKTVLFLREPNDMPKICGVMCCAFFSTTLIKVESHCRSTVRSLSIVIMVILIKLFQRFQKFHQMRIIGISSFQANSNSRKTFGLIFFGQFTVTTVAFLVFDAKSLFDYGFGFFTVITAINFNIMYLIFIWEFENTYKFIGNCERFIEKSK